MQVERPNFLSTENPPPRREIKKYRRWIFLALTVFLFSAGCLTYGKITTEVPNDPERYDPTSLEPKAPIGFIKKLQYFVFGRDVKLSGEREDRINVLLLGMSGAGYDGPYLTDTIILASIKPSTKQVAMISVPRDLGVNIPNYGRQKINHANAYGEAERQNWGAALATEVVEKTFNIDIQYYLRLDFKAFAEIIDEVGGINVNVDRHFVDSLYPTESGGYQTISFAAEPQTMDGERALEYARSRHGSNNEGSDFARAARQQKVILALKEKVLSFNTLANPVRIHNVVSSLENHLTTNMEFSDIIAMIRVGRELNVNSIIRLVLDTGPNGYLRETFTDGGAFMLEPKTGNFEEINHLVENIFTEKMPEPDNTPPQTAPLYTSADIEIQNGTWQAGMAARLKKKLENDGFSIATVGNTEVRPQPSSGIFAVSSSTPDDVIRGLVQALRIPAKETPPEGVKAASTTDILVVLGDNFNE